jgi:NADPH-dependent 2,4-dienoyl-CoA reductase/sulfur reductase-like enzyme
VRTLHTQAPSIGQNAVSTSDRRSGMDAHARHVVILGGGFGGLWATRALATAPVRVTLVDRTNHHLFQPLLYQVALAGLSAPDIACRRRTSPRRCARSCGASAM